jgi:methylated-DNA-protein-cysteine methyltransferase-like protein
MALSPRDRRVKSELLAALAEIPRGRVATVDLIADRLAVPAAFVAKLMATLTEDERETVPWHRVVAKGGAIGWGAQREAQFARLLREGIPVAPAGIVQDMARIGLASSEGKAGSKVAHCEQPETPAPRWRGMKRRPE